MKKNKMYISFNVIVVAILLTFSSCMTTRTTIGEGPVGKGEAKKVCSKTKQVYLFWGLMSLGNSQPKVPSHGNVQIKTSYNVADALVSGLTGGLFAMQTIKVLIKKEDFFKDQNIANKNIGSGNKVIFTSSSQQNVGEVVSIDNTKGKAKVKFLNNYGEERYKDKKYENLNPVSEEHYQKFIAKQQTEIQKHKFSIDEKATWINKKESCFGTIIHLDDINHKASVESLNVLHEKELSKINYLELNKLSEDKFVQLLQLHKEKEDRYKFSVGENVIYKSLTGKGKGEIIVLDENSHKATIEYINKKNEKKTITVGYLDLIKL